MDEGFIRELIGELTLEQRVGLGMEYLDENRPGWENLISLDEGFSYAGIRRTLAFNPATRLAYTGAFWCAPWENSSDLTEAWISGIKRRFELGVFSDD